MSEFTPLAAAALALALLAAPAASLAQQPIEAENLPVYGELGPNAAGNAPEAGFVVRGPFARQMFDMMGVPDRQEPCTGGWYREHASGFNCTVAPDGEASCSFGYDYQTGRVTRGPQVC